MASTHKSLRSGTANKRPTTSIADGQIALNTNTTSPGLFFKDSTGATIIKVGPVHVGTTAPNASPAAGGSSGNSTGEVWLDTSLTPNGVKIWNGASWTNATPIGSTTVQGLLELATNAETQTGTDPDRAVTPAGLQSKVSDSTSTTSSTTIASSTAVKSAYDLANAALPKSGGTVTGNLEIGTTGSLSFEGATADAFETTIAVVDPTADRTITLPDTTGTVVTTGDTGTVTSTMIADGTIVNGDINASAAIAGTKISPDFGSQTITTTGVVSAALGAAATPSLTFTGDLNTGIYSPGADQVAISTNGSERARIDSSGRLLVGTSSSRAVGGAAAGDFQIEVSGSKRCATFVRNGGTSILTLGSTGATGIGNTTILANNDGLGSIEFAGADGTDLQTLGASISAEVDGTPGANDMPGRLVFSTTADGASSPTERLRITSAGNVGIGTTGPGRKLAVTDDSGADTALALTCSANTRSFIQYASSATNVYAGNDGGSFVVWPGASEKLRVDTSGRLLVGTSTTYGSSANLQVVGTPSAAASIDINRFTNGTGSGSLYFYKSRGASVGTNTIVNSDDELGALYFMGANGTSYNLAASIIANVDGTPGASNDMPGRLVFSTTADGAASPTERMRIDSSGRVGIGTSSPSTLLHLNSATATNTTLAYSENGTLKWYNRYNASDGSFQIVDVVNSLTRLHVSNTGAIGIGTTSPALKLHVEDSGSQVVRWTRTGVGAGSLDVDASGNAVVNAHTSSTGIAFHLQASEKARIDSSGRLLVGTSSAETASLGALFQIQTTGSSASALIKRNDNGALPSYLYLGKSRGTTVNSTTIVQSGDSLGAIRFTGADGSTEVGSIAAQITAAVDGTPGANDMPGRLVFSTTADGASSPTERMRITADGAIRLNTTSTNVYDKNTNSPGVIIQSNGFFEAARYQADVAAFNREGNDGIIIGLWQDGTQEGNISVSGTTVSYNGAHLSRWTQLTGGTERTEILRGTVLSNLDEMCEWGDEDNEQLNRMKVSDVEGDKNVAGVFQAWDDDDDTYTNDFYCAMTGDFIIRIAENVTVERGDLLMSAGDGTAKPQDDDIIRSKTIAKVTSTNVSCTYEDGSYCVPCVLMAC